MTMRIESENRRTGETEKKHGGDDQKQRETARKPIRHFCDLERGIPRNRQRVRTHPRTVRSNDRSPGEMGHWRTKGHMNMQDSPIHDFTHSPFLRFSVSGINTQRPFRLCVIRLRQRRHAGHRAFRP